MTTTYRGASGANLAQVAALNSKSDIFILTYYPMHGDFQVDSPQAPANDFPQMLTLAAGLPVVLQEAGYPSAALNGSSQAMQGQFVTSALAAWHAAGTKMPVLNYFLLHDLDPTTCSSLAVYYGLSADQNFSAYLCSLGLRDDADVAKPAWGSFLAGAQ